MKDRRCITSLCLALLAASANANESTLTVDFSPEPAAWEREYRMIATVIIDGKPGSTSSVQSLRQQVIKQEETGWSISSIPNKIQIDGVESSLDRAIQDILLGQDFILYIDQQGQFESVAGFDALREEVTRQIPAEARDAVSQVVNAETQRWRLANQWQTENAWLYGKEWIIGKEYVLEKRLDAPDGPAMNFTQKSTLLPIESEGVLRIAYSSEAIPVKGADLKQLGSLKVTEEGERSFDLSSGLPLEETSTRRVELSFRGPEGLIPQVREEAKHITYRRLEE